MLEDRALESPLEARYAGWDADMARKMMDGSMGLDAIEQYVLDNDVNPEPRSGQQEKLENIVNRYV